MPSEQDDNVLIAKINALNISSIQCEEKRLVEIVLISRLGDEKKMQSLWTPAHMAFCFRLLIDVPTAEVYVPLVSSLVPRLPQQHPEQWKRLGDALESIIANRTRRKAALSEIDVDLVEALQVCITGAKESRLKTAFKIIWKRFYQTMVKGHITKTDPMPAQGALDHDHDWETMKATVSAIARQEELTGSDLVERYHESVLVAWSFMAENTPSDTGFTQWYKEMISWVSSGRQLPPENVRDSWNFLALTCTHAMIVKQQLTLLSSHQDTIINLILGHVSSPIADVPLRSGSWAVLNALIQKGGRDWLMKAPTSSTLGRATAVCTLNRLASGEWRIQLGRFCTEGAAIPSSKEDALTSLLDNCALFIVDQLHNLGIMADQMDKSLPYTPDALLHLRQSFMDVFHATVQYLCQDQQNPKIQTLAAFMLGELLTEFDPEEDLPEGLSKEEVFQAVEIASQVPDKYSSR
jgi:hypothetical protein